MRWSVFLLALGLLLSPAHADNLHPDKLNPDQPKQDQPTPDKVKRIQHVTVQQLEAMLEASRGVRDKELAEQIADLQLTERLSIPRQAQLDAALPGAASCAALTTLGDSAEFLDLPPTDILPTPAPDHARQTAILSLTRDYVVKTILKMPNFFATRETTSFERAPEQFASPLTNADNHFPLHPVSHSSVTVLYRDNRELVAKGKGRNPYTKQLRTVGEFGPILATVLHDAAKGRVTWSHWEQGASGPMAVFNYVIPEAESHYTVGYIDIEHGTRHDPAYHGEMGVDPVDGSILRLTAIAELRLDDPIAIADLLVDYGPVEIGGVPYICPVKSVAFSQVRMVVQELDFKTGAEVGKSLGPAKMYLNEVLFKDYHRFRAETRILAGDSADPSAVAPASSPR